jgi:hypothetical protein
MFDPRTLERTLDLWASSWEAEERAAIERALAKILAGTTPLPTQLAALAACYAIGTSALHAAAAGASQFTAEEIAGVREATLDLARCLEVAERMRGDRAVIELLLDDPSGFADELLDRVDVRDLHFIAQANGDERIAGEAARRIARRGEHQRRRLARALGISVGELRALYAASYDATDPAASPSIV